MTAIAVAGGKGAPGASTTALLLAATWSDPVDRFVVEVDPDGGSLCSRAQVPSTPGLASLAAASRHSAESVDLGEHAHPLRLGPALVPAPPSPEQVVSALTASRHLATCFDQTDAMVFVDCGRLSTDSRAFPLAAHADLVVVVCRPELEQLQNVLQRVTAMRGSNVTAALALVGSRPYPADEVAEALDVPVLAVLADDPATARALPLLVAGGRHFTRSALARSGRALSEACRSLLHESPALEVSP